MGVPYDAVQIRMGPIKGMMMMFESGGNYRFHISIHWSKELLQSLLVIRLAGKNAHPIYKCSH